MNKKNQIICDYGKECKNYQVEITQEEDNSVIFWVTDSNGKRYLITGNELIHMCERKMKDNNQKSKESGCNSSLIESNEDLREESEW